MTAHVVLTQTAHVREIRLNRPEKRNAITGEMYAAMADALLDAEQDAGVRAVVFSGEGPSFTAGNDLHDFMASSRGDGPPPVYRFLHALAQASVPLVAAVQGNAVGIGTTMLLHCDLVVATTDAAFRLPFADLGLVPEAASSLLLARALGPHRAAAMLMLGDALPADAAHAAGFVHAIAQDARATAHVLAARLAAKPAEALRATRRLMRGDQAEVLARMEAEGAVFAERLASAEFRAAATAFFARAS